MRPSKFEGVFRRFAREDSIEEARSKPIASTDPIVHIKLALWRNVAFTIDPGDSAPARDGL